MPRAVVHRLGYKLVSQISGCYCLESRSALEREGVLYKARLLAHVAERHRPT
jgi:hypothetical protein